MENPISVIYNYDTQEKLDFSAKIINALSDRGICFHASKSKEGDVALIVDNHKYSLEFIKEHEKEVFGLAEVAGMNYMKKKIEEIGARKSAGLDDKVE